MIEAPAREQILDAAEKRARMAGYHGFSFRDVAEDVGIKSSSVHYHFPTKGDLCEALARRYTVRAADRLGDPRILAPGEARQWSKKLPPETKFIGVTAAYRDIERAHWRALVAVQPQAANTLTIRAEALAVSASVAAH